MPISICRVDKGTHMSDTTRDLLAHGIAAAKAHEYKEAQYYLERLLEMDAPEDERMDAYYYLSEAADDPKSKRNWLEEILARNPFDARARRSLAIMDGKIKPTEVIDPDRYIKPSETGEVGVDASRFVCPKCGGKMVYTPDGTFLTCESCASESDRLNKNSGSPEQDFFLALATTMGHSSPMNRQTFNCQGCGAEFILPPDRLTITCPYCNSAHIVKTERDLFPPTTIIPLGIDEYQARSCLRSWFEKHPPKEPVRVFPAVGMYFPVWSFTIGGMVEWSAMLHIGREWEKITGTDVVLFQNVIASAGSHLPHIFFDETHNYDLNGVVPFNEGYLADWTAETYQVSVADASLDAREMAMHIEKAKILGQQIASLRDFSLSTAGMVVEGFQLLLPPAWVTSYHSADTCWKVMINGQNGNVRDERKRNGDSMSFFLGK